ncbi:hypothetical protein ABBQ32_008898 [Trebouxia sp. C0010 RCD-2024]
MLPLLTHKLAFGICWHQHVLSYGHSTTRRTTGVSEHYLTCTGTVAHVAVDSWYAVASSCLTACAHGSTAALDLMVDARVVTPTEARSAISKQLLPKPQDMPQC